MSGKCRCGDAVVCDDPVINLYSASRARAELLRNAGLRIRVIPVDVDETARPGGTAGETVLALASRKLDAALRSVSGAAGSWGLAADTLVEGPGGLLGKPADRESARAMLLSLSGRRCRVHSAAVLYAPKEESDAETRIKSTVHGTAVDFLDCSAEEIESYLDTGEWRGAAGGFRIQGRGGFFAVSINGLMSTAAGLPLNPLYAILREASYPFIWGPVGGSVFGS